MNRRRLGRGLEALLGREEMGFEETGVTSSELLHLGVDQIDPNPYQPRKRFPEAEIATLADSLRQHGMLQPILVRAVGGRYQLIAGERRYRASLEARLIEIPARVLELDDKQVFELAMVENLQREDLNAVDKATAFREYLSRYGGTQEELAGRLGLDRSTISNLIRILDLPEEVLDAVRTEKITQGHARALLGLTDVEAQLAAFHQVLSQHLSVRQTEALVSTGVPTPARPRLRRDAAHSSAPKAPHLVDIERVFHERLGTRVFVKEKDTERGQIIIDYTSRAELERLGELMKSAMAATSSD